MKLILQVTGAALLVLSAWAVLLEVRHCRQCRHKPPCDCEYAWDIDWTGYPR